MLSIYLFHRSFSSTLPVRRDVAYSTGRGTEPRFNRSWIISNMERGTHIRGDRSLRALCTQHTVSNTPARQGPRRKRARQSSGQRTTILRQIPPSRAQRRTEYHAGLRTAPRALKCIHAESHTERPEYGLLDGRGVRCFGAARLARAVAGLESVCTYIHSPAQAGKERPGQCRLRPAKRDGRRWRRPGLRRRAAAARGGDGPAAAPALDVRRGGERGGRPRGRV